MWVYRAAFFTAAVLATNGQASHLAEGVHDIVDGGGEGQLPALRHSEQAAKGPAVVVARLHLGHNLHKQSII
jgi:hypothetical protein